MTRKVFTHESFLHAKRSSIRLNATVNAYTHVSAQQVPCVIDRCLALKLLGLMTHGIIPFNAIIRETIPENKKHLNTHKQLTAQKHLTMHLS